MPSQNAQNNFQKPLSPQQTKKDGGGKAQPFFWFQSYPPDIPHTIDLNRYDSIGELFNETVKKYSNKKAFYNMGTSLSFSDIDRMSWDFGAFLLKIGLKKGDKIALQLPNILQYPICLFGALRVGIVVVNTNPLYTDREMLVQFQDSGVKGLVIVLNFIHHLEKVVTKTNLEFVIVTEIADVLTWPKRILVNNYLKYIKKMAPKSFTLPVKTYSLREALYQGKHALSVKADEITKKDLAFLQYTGGTTGVPKGAMLTHGNILANMLQCSEWMSQKFIEGEEICMTPLPIYHVFSLTVNCLAFFKYGALNVLITNPRDISGFIKELKKWKFSVMTGVNTLFNSLLNHPDFKSVDFSHLKLCVAGAMAVSKIVFDRWKKTTGTPILEGYGLSEASPVVCCNPTINPQDGTVGLPLPSTEVSLRDDNGREVQIGEQGEIWVRGPQVMLGYYNKNEESNAVFSSDGFLKTGDIGVFLSNGFLKIVDRKKDMITVSGFKVYPNEVEDVLMSHPKISEVGVIGVPDEKSGEIVKAFVVKKDPSLTLEELRKFSKENFTGYKVPRIFEFVEELPKTNVGKISRKDLRKL